MKVAFATDPLDIDRPLMYQGLSDRFLPPRADVPFPNVTLGIDFESEFGVIVNAVPMGTCAKDAAAHVRLLVQINDWSLRALASIEMKTRFGWVRAPMAFGDTVRMAGQRGDGSGPIGVIEQEVVLADWKTFPSFLVRRAPATTCARSSP